MLRLAEANEELITIKKYKINDDTYTSERAETHRIIISKKVRDKARSEGNEAILLGGGSGAGKSTIVKEYLLPEVDDIDSINEFVYIDADQIKLMLDEYQEYVNNDETRYFAAFYVHGESGDIVTMLLQECIDRELSFIYDGTMSWKPLYDDLLSKLKRKSYNTLGIYVDVDLEVAKKRVIKRGEDEGRYVSVDVVERANRNSAIVFRQIKHRFDEVAMFNNTEERNENSRLERKPFYRREVPCTRLFTDGQVNDQEKLDLYHTKSFLPYLEE